MVNSDRRNEEKVRVTRSQSKIVLYRDKGKISVQTGYNLFLKILTEETMTTEAGSYFLYLTTLDEKADHLLRRWTMRCNTV